MIETDPVNGVAGSSYCPMRSVHDVGSVGLGNRTSTPRRNLGVPVAWAAAHFRAVADQKIRQNPCRDKSIRLRCGNRQVVKIGSQLKFKLTSGLEHQRDSTDGMHALRVHLMPGSFDRARLAIDAMFRPSEQPARSAS